MDTSGERLKGRNAVMLAAGGQIAGAVAAQHIASNDP